MHKIARATPAAQEVKQLPHKPLHWGVCYLFPSIFNWISVMRPKSPD